MEQLANGDFFKSKREERQERRWEYKQPRANSFLIVTAGDGTEYLYFKTIADRIREQAGGNIRVVNIPSGEVGGKGRGSARMLLAKTEEMVGKANVLYQNIWIVFEKDDFDDFDWIIREAEKKGYHVAWNNQSFEYWVYLHFDYSDADLSREDWQEKLKIIFQVRGVSGGEFRRDDMNTHLALSEYSSLDTAIKNGRQRMEQFKPRYDVPSEYVPGLTLHLLAEQLLSYLPEEIKLEETASGSPDAAPQPGIAENSDASEKPEDTAQKPEGAKEQEAAEAEDKEGQDAKDAAEKADDAVNKGKEKADGDAEPDNTEET